MSVKIEVDASKLDQAVKKKNASLEKENKSLTKKLKALQMKWDSHKAMVEETRDMHAKMKAVVDEFSEHDGCP